MKRTLGLSIVLLLAFMLGACAQTTTTPAADAAPETRQFTIGMANFSQCCAYFIGMNNVVIDEAKFYSNITIISTDANGDAAKFDSDIEGLIAKKVDGIIVSGAWLEQM